MTSEHLAQRFQAHLHETVKGPHVVRTRQFGEIYDGKDGIKLEPPAKRLRASDSKGQQQTEFLVPNMTHDMSLKAAIISEFSAMNSMMPQSGFGGHPYLQSLYPLFGAFQREGNQPVSMFGGTHFPRAAGGAFSGFSRGASNEYSSTPVSALVRGPIADYSLASTMMPPANFFHSMEARLHAQRATTMEILQLSLCNNPSTGKPPAYISGLTAGAPSFPPPQRPASTITEKRNCMGGKELLSIWQNQTPIGEWKPPTELPAILAVPDDRLKLSQHQILLRHQIEAFEATEDDVTTHTRGRNKPIVLGQVGIRCRHCKHVPVAKRQKGGVYFPATLLGLYQAVQNMSATHMQCGLCNDMPHAIKHTFAVLMSTKSSSSGTGRHYWAQTAKKIGLIDTEDGMRFGKDVMKEETPVAVPSVDNNC